MKISAFHIRNYRSIINSGKCCLSPDCITALIGQNESGKTSVLEALRSFYEGTITDDILRSDLTFPEITCYFILDEGRNLGDYFDMSGIPEELHATLSSKKEISLTRKWTSSKNNILFLSEPEFLDFFEKIEKQRIENTEKVVTSIPGLIKQTEVAAREMEASENAVGIAKNELNNFYSRVEDLKRSVPKVKNPDIQITYEQDLKVAENNLEEAEKTLKDKLTWLEEKKVSMQQLAEKLSIAKSFTELTSRVETLLADKEERSALLHETEHQYELCKSEKEAKVILKRLEQLREIHNRITYDLEQQSVLLLKRRKIACKLLSGKHLKDSEHEAAHEYEIESSYFTLEELGKSVFKHIPMFEFFEDFSSLLPNKIDLDDLLNENTQSEGYKAARNFLCVAGLNADFFREKNHRILKQKIENLNTEITIDFQDYWRQSVGKDDKIRINFELEHYDNSQPEKSGKPYLEFWVKDKQERLYPKQRSRGVRWFLSFYLELKATAKEKSVDRIMLIDEPGLSLHARAQEDVLKVFEDLRDNLQIIYCTHSPNLIDVKKLYRIIAVQRARETDEKSESLVLDARSLNEASADTLSPIYSLMGTRLNDRQFVFPKNNIIVEDTVTFYYLEALLKLYGFTDEVHFIPSTNPEQVPVFANILFGWRVNFGIILMEKNGNQHIAEILNANTFYKGIEQQSDRLQVIEGFSGIEDCFSTIDFKRFVLKQRIGITVKNSEFIENNKLSRLILASDFSFKIQKENIQLGDFDEESQANFGKLFSFVKKVVEALKL